MRGALCAPLFCVLRTIFVDIRGLFCYTVNLIGYVLDWGTTPLKQYHNKQGGFSNEKNISAEEASSQEGTWFPQENGYR